jgi:hypothetical protein
VSFLLNLKPPPGAASKSLLQPFASASVADALPAPRLRQAKENIPRISKVAKVEARMPKPKHERLKPGKNVFV